MQDINDLALKMQMRILMVSKKIKRQEVEPPVKVYARELASTTGWEIQVSKRRAIRNY